MSEQRSMRRFFQRTLPVLSALVLLLVALYLAVSRFSDYYVWVFALTALALLVLAGAIGHRVYRLRDLKAGLAGKVSFQNAAGKLLGIEISLKGFSAALQALL